MLRWQFEKARAGKNKELENKYAEKICELVYRSRFRYMNHWEALRQKWVRMIKHPEWGNPKTAPWKGKSDYTKSEVDDMFKKVVKFFPNEKIEIKRFSKKLVPIDWSNAKDKLVKREGGIWQCGHLMWIYSFGKPIDLTVEPNLTGLVKSTICTLKTADGATILVQRGTLNAKKRCEFSLKVPEAGLYQIFVDNIFWRLGDYHTTTPMVIPTKTNYIHSGWQTPTCFYVPKGTKNLELIGHFSGDCDIFTDGNWKHVVGKIKQSKNGEIQSIAVPEGEEGKVWTFRNVMINSVWFLNAPNYLGYSPYGMMVPKEVAEKDGLRIKTKK